MDTIEIKVNKLPSPTMSRLKLNHAVMSIAAPQSFSVPVFNAPDGVAINSRKYSGKDDRELFDGSDEYSVEYKKDAELTAEYDLDPGSTVSALSILVDDNVSATLIIRYSAKDPSDCGFGGFKIRAEVGNNSSLHVVQLSVLGNGELYTNVQSDCAENSSVKLTTICLGASKAFIGADCRLNGKRACFDSDTAYILGEGEMLDMNYNCDHIERKTDSLIKASGVMKAASIKNSRQTINFIKGCSASKGAESEEVLLLDDDVINKSLPVILCTEEDVEGEHGASIGQPDEDELYYLRSRGLDDETILGMLSSAKILSAAARIDHEPTVRIIKDYLGISEEE